MNFKLLSPRSRRGISLTALIDVVFILLLFFMLTSSFDHRRALELQLPTVGTSVATAEPPNFVILHADGSVSPVDQANPALHLAAAASATELARQLNTQQATVLIPEAAASLQQIIGTLEQLRAAGLPQVALGEALPAPKEALQ